MSQTKLKMIDLFAGTGAFTYAFQETNKVECVFANDFDKNSKLMYDANFDHELTFRDINDINVAEIPPHDILTGGFPCFPAGTKVLSNNGYKNIEDVKLTDKLLTHTNSFQNIVNLQRKKYSGFLYKFATRIQSESITCTDEHPFYVRQKQKTGYSDPEWKQANKIRKTDYMGMAINTDSIIPDFFMKLDREEHWFLIGYFIGNGILENYDRPEIFFTINDSIAYRKISSVLPIIIDYDGLYWCTDQEWYNLLKTFTKSIPEWTQNAPSYLIQALLNGYNTTLLEKKRNNLTFEQVLSLQRLYLKTGKIMCVQRKKGIRHLKELKRNRSFIDGNYCWFPVTSIEKEEVTDLRVYNFEVENDNSYIVQNTIVHNCQPFSIAGKKEGFNDERSNVFWKILKIIDHHRPRCIVLENVKNLVSHDEGNTFEVIKNSLTTRGYHLYFRVLDTSKISGIPQHRERIYIVGLLNPIQGFDLEFEEIPKRNISDFLQTNVMAKYYYVNSCSIWNELVTNVTKFNTCYQYRRYYVRENMSGECPTLTANMGTGGHNVPIIKDVIGIRKLTPRECFNFQGFPSTYILPNISDCHLYKLAGNAVSVPVVKLIADRLMNYLI